MSDSEKIRSVLGALLRISLEDTSLVVQLEQALERIFTLPWLALEAKGAIFLTEDGQEALVMKAHCGLAAPLLTLCARVPFGRCICGRAAASAAVEFADCVDHRHETQYEGMVSHGHYAVPIVLRGKVLGVIVLYVREGHPRDRQEEEFLRTVADLLAGILAHKKTQGQLASALASLRKTLGSTVQAMGATLESRDPYTAGHQRRVAGLSRAVAGRMGLGADVLDVVHTAATIHDIGKIAVPAEILNKPGPLNETELDLIRMHPKVGYDILRGIDFQWPIAQIVLQHHERMDGSGYPAGLSGQDILLEARILAVADVVEAMATHRPYRPARGLDEAIAEISDRAAAAYDPQAANACVQILREGGFDLNT